MVSEIILYTIGAPLLQQKWLERTVDALAFCIFIIEVNYEKEEEEEVSCTLLYDNHWVIKLNKYQYSYPDGSKSENTTSVCFIFGSVIYS